MNKYRSHNCSQLTEKDSEKKVSLSGWLHRKRAYRKLVSQNHPDKLIGQGVPDDIIKLATERTQKIQMAYDLISESRKTK